MYNVLHVLYQSYPNISGSSTRSKSIVDAMHQSALFNPSVITSPLQAGVSVGNVELIDDVQYYRTFKCGNDKYEVNKPKNFFTKLKKAFSFVFFTYDIFVVAKEKNVDVIHAHAMSFCGLPSLFVARILNKKFVYEIRSDWHLDKSFSSGIMLQKVFGYMEAYVAKKSDSLVVISQGLFEKYSKFNHNCYLVSNGVHDDRFASFSPASISTSNVVTYGFIGSVIPLEGLEMVVQAISNLRTKYNVVVSLKIAGMGESLEAIKDKARELGVQEQVIICGSLPFERVGEFYDGVDVIVNFRRNEEIAHSVTPLKPLEAMAQKKLTIVSDVKGMLELVTEGVNGIVVPAENVEALTDIMFDVFCHREKYTKIVEVAYKYVVDNYSWSKKINQYVEVYS
ncbi:glycosyltransferase family 4 protein [Shewanella algae]|uniref:glycosyltransferase family 4 protein n=1 Tax=Shewanella algae TaxID=38313 RepID=UPI0031F4A396